MSYFMAGGMYLKTNAPNHPYLPSKRDYEFGAVHPTGELPYIWENVSDIKVVSHHASIYQLSDDFKRAHLIKDFGSVPSPKNVVLPYGIYCDIAKAIQNRKNA